jgi:hypothetical protein
MELHAFADIGFAEATVEKQSMPTIKSRRFIQFSVVWLWYQRMFASAGFADVVAMSRIEMSDSVL